MKKIFFSIVFFIIILVSCRDPWENYGKINESTVTKSLMELINENPDFSTFKKLVELVGWNKNLNSNKLYTLWVPDNNAFNELPDSLLNDTVYVKFLIENHIVNGKYFYNNVDISDSIKIKMIAGKNVIFYNKKMKIGNVEVNSSYFNIPARNGVIHKINKIIIPKKNIWEFIETTDLCKEHTNYLKSLSKYIFDPSRAIQIGVDPVTGRPIYDSASGMVWYNEFISKVCDLTDEDSEYTVFLLTDEVFVSQIDSFIKFYTNRNDPNYTLNLTKWNVSKDLVFRDKFSIENSPDTLISLFGVKVPFNKSAIYQNKGIELSNGVVYILNDCKIKKEDKIKPIIIEGEQDLKYMVYSPAAVSSMGRIGYKRQKDLASGGYDFILDYHLANPGIIRYYVGMVNSVRYKIYWKAVNDFYGRIRNQDINNPVELRQKLGIAKILGYQKGVPIFGTPEPLHEDFIDIIDKSYETAEERFIGQYRFFDVNDNLWLEVTGGGNNMTLTIDYIKLVPDFQE